MSLKVLVACEFSGVVRDAFRAKGHDAISCDFLPTERDGPHYQGHVFDIIDDSFDLMVAHPPCTRLCNSGVQWLSKRDLWNDMKIAAGFFVGLQNAPIDKIVIENPIPHKYAVEIIGKYDQIVQPWQFGHGETKATCLWLKNLPCLVSTDIVSGREQNVFRLPPTKDRAKLRSITYSGVAKAMAEQWGAIC